jgi:hypothetical protein
VLSSVRGGADLDFHVIAPKDGSWREPKLHDFTMDNLLDRFSDVVKVECSGFGLRCLGNEDASLRNTLS